MIVEWHTLTLLMSLVVFIAATPGPDVFYIASNGLSGKFSVGFAAMLGVFTGNLTYVFATALGLANLFMLFPALYIVIKWLGVAYLAYMGYGFIKSAMKPGKDLEVAVSQEKQLWKVYTTGLLVNLLNPKAVLFFTAFLPQFLDLQAGHISQQLLILGLAAVGVGHLVYIGHTVFFVMVGRKLKQREGFRQGAKPLRILDGFCGVLYLCFSFGLAAWKRT